MASNPQLSVLTTSKSAQLRYLYRTVTDGFFYSIPPKPEQQAAFLALVQDPETDPLTSAEMQLQWMSHRRYRTTTPQPEEKAVEEALNAAMLRYSAQYTPRVV